MIIRLIFTLIILVCCAQASGADEYKDLSAKGFLEKAFHYLPQAIENKDVFFPKVLESLNLGVQKGCLDCSYYLSQIYRGEYGFLKPDGPKAMEILDSGAARGGTKCCVRLAIDILQRSKIGDYEVFYDPLKAERLLRIAYKNRDLVAGDLYPKLYRDGILGYKDYIRYVELLLPNEEKDSRIRGSINQARRNPEEQDYVKLVEGARAHHVEDIMTIAQKYIEGEKNVRQDIQKALQYVRMACDLEPDNDQAADLLFQYDEPINQKENLLHLGKLCFQTPNKRKIQKGVRYLCQGLRYNSRRTSIEDDDLEALALLAKHADLMCRSVCLGALFNSKSYNAPHWLGVACSHE